LSENLNFYATLECRESRDRICALLGISSDADELGIVPNYNGPLKAFLMEVSKLVYLKEQSLSLLDGNSGRQPSADSTIPSWVYRGSARKETMLPSYRPYGNLLEDGMPIRFEDADSAMICTGRLLDVIQDPVNLAGFIDSTWSDDDWTKLHRQIITTVSRYTEHVDWQLDGINKVYGVLIADSDLPVAGLSLNCSFNIWCLCRLLATLLDEETNGAIKGDIMFCDMLVDLLTKVQTFVDVTEHGGAMAQLPWSELTKEEEHLGNEVWRRARIQGRAMCTTEGGRLCNTTGSVKVADRIAFLAGSSQLSVLREVGVKRFHYIGNAYVYGLMNAEVCGESGMKQIYEDILIV
jgi:hypothetical protein